MPFGSFMNAFPPAFFLLVHIILFVIGAVFAYRAYSANANYLGVAFTLFAIAELVYMTYHLDWTVFLFAHTIAEVLDVIAFILVYVSATRYVFAVRRSHAAAPAE